MKLKLPERNQTNRDNPAKTNAFDGSGKPHRKTFPRITLWRRLRLLSMASLLSPAMLLCLRAENLQTFTAEKYPVALKVPSVDGPAIWKESSQPVDARVQDLIGRLTLEEKVELLTVAASVKFKGVPRLGIPNMISSDGPRGPHGPVGYPCGLAMGASFDPALLKEEATAMGEECRARGIAMLYGPAININRDPLAGRFFEYFTEDPCLDAKMAVAFVQGVQSQNVAACAKHFACNNRDWNRDNYMSLVDLRTLHEIYFPAFKAAVEEGHVLGVMTAANGLNNDFCSDSHFLITDTLENTWGFNGFVFTDGIGSHSTIKAALAGLDISNLGQPTRSLFGKPLMEAIMAGEVPMDTIDEKVRRILRVMAWAGNLNDGGIKPEGKVDLTAHENLALKGAEEGLVLLKNEGHLLPLDARKIRSILVLGPNADQRFCELGLGGSSWVNSPDEVTILNGIRSLVGPKIDVKYISRDALGGFEPIDANYLETDNGSPGFDAQYFNGPISSSPVLTRLEKKVDFNWEMKSPDVTKINTDNFSAQFTTTINPPLTGTYTLRIKTDNSASLYVDRKGGAPIAVTSRKQGAAEVLATLQMVKGTPCFIRIDYIKNPGDAYLSLDWAMPSVKGTLQNNSPELDQQIKEADAVVFVGGIDNSLDAEGRDRLNMDFPQWQENLINHVSTLNPRTVVVLINGSPLKISGWLKNVPAVLEAWYAGSRAGTAVAGILFGDVDPSGRLPFTWPKRLEDSPSHAIGTENINVVRYTEGIYTGYRYYLTKHVAPQFPFGFGLSYTRFEYSDLKVSASNGNWTVTAAVKNVGDRDGADVAQLYIHPETAGISRPVRELKGFEKVFLKQGETKLVTLTLKPMDFAFYDVERNAWNVEEGNYELQLGASSADIKLRQTISVGGALISD
jgi:beta-glucosidase